MRKTKIVCTLGPSTDDECILEAVMHAGMDVARLNFSHGTHEEHKTRIESVRKTAQSAGKTVAIMLDTKGPEIRVRQFRDGSVELKEGDEFRFWCTEKEGDAAGVSVTYRTLNEKLKPDDIILADDGLLSFRVLSTDGESVITSVVTGGPLSNNKSLNIPDVVIPMPALTSKDKEDLLFGIENGLDFVAASFVRSASDVREIRAFLEENDGSRLKIISKIENRQGVDNMDEIVAESDGIMVARGDLGVEIPPEEVPLIQKRLVKKCNEAGKPVIIATQMLDSMIRNPRPTRAEATDVANAVLDGADAVMLSGETAAGRYPVESVETMDRIARSAESEYTRSVREFYGDDTITNVVSFSSCSAANRLGAAAIITPTESGYTPRMVSKYRPHAVIIAVSSHDWVQRQLVLTRGVVPLLMPELPDFDQTVNECILSAVKCGYVKKGDAVVITNGLPATGKSNTNTMRIEEVSAFVLTGAAAGTKAVNGPFMRFTGSQDIPEGSIVMTSTVNDRLVRQAGNIAGIITPQDLSSGSCAAFAQQHGITVLAGTDNDRIFRDGDPVEIDPAADMAYRKYE